MPTHAHAQHSMPMSSSAPCQALIHTVCGLPAPSIHSCAPLSTFFLRLRPYLHTPLHHCPWLRRPAPLPVPLSTHLRPHPCLVLPVPSIHGCAHPFLATLKRYTV